MTEIPCIVFLPAESKARSELLEGFFGSKVNVKILSLFFSEDCFGVKEKVYQQDIIAALPYSNKTVIQHISELSRIGVLNEGMEKVRGWKKYLFVPEKMHWLVLLLQDPKDTSKGNEPFRRAMKEFTMDFLKRVRELIDDGVLDESEVNSALSLKSPKKN